jgi:hypothetical protein
MLRLDETTRETLEELSRHFKKPIAGIIRQLIAQATPEDFPSSWRMTAHERRAREAQPSHDGLAGRDPLESRIRRTRLEWETLSPVIDARGI